MSDDLLATARGYLRPPPGMESVEGYTAAAAHATVDAAETLRRIEALLAPDDDHERIAMELRAARWTKEPAPDAPATPQVGEVWEDADGEVVRVTELRGDSPHRCVILTQGRGVHDKPDTTVLRYIDTATWRRVSPAPAPLTERERVVADGLAAIAMTEREVTAEAEAQGVEPASDEELAVWGDALAEPTELWPLTSRNMEALIARVRAEQAAREDAQARLGRLTHQHAYEQARAEEAEAQVERMRPVVEAAEEYEDTHPSTEGHTSACRLVCPAVRAYREATRGE